MSTLSSGVRVFSYPGRIDFLDTGIPFFNTPMGEDAPHYIAAQARIAPEEQVHRERIQELKENKPRNYQRGINANYAAIQELRATLPEAAIIYAKKKKDKKLKPVPYETRALPVAENGADTETK